MRYFKRINITNGAYKKGKIYKETDKPHLGSYGVKDSVRLYPYRWKEVSEIEYIKQEGWYIKGSDEFRKWLNNNKDKVNRLGAIGSFRNVYYTCNYGEDKIIARKSNVKDKIEVTIDQLNEIYNNSLNVTDTGESFTVSFKKQNDMENFQVKVTPTTSRILQELAFENGWSWRSGSIEVENLNRSILAFALNTKNISMGSLLGAKEVSLEEAINRITTKEESFKEGDWFAVDNCDGGYETWIGKVGEKYEYTNGGSWSYPKSFIKTHARKATDEEIKSALVKEAKRRGFKAGVAINNSPIGYFARSGKVKNNEFRYNSSADRLDIDRFYIYQHGKWAEIVDEPKEIFGFKVKKLNNGYYAFGCADHVYSPEELERVIKTLRNVDAKTTVGELVEELKRVGRSFNL